MNFLKVLLNSSLNKSFFFFSSSLFNINGIHNNEYHILFIDKYIKIRNNKFYKEKINVLIVFTNVELQFVIRRFFIIYRKIRIISESREKKANLKEILREYKLYNRNN